jgi:hypothetical protein
MGGLSHSDFQRCRSRRLAVCRYIANYSHRIGLHFMALAPLIITDTELGKYAISRYSRYLGISTGDFIQGMTSPPSRPRPWSWQ